MTGRMGNISISPPFPSPLPVLYSRRRPGGGVPSPLRHITHPSGVIHDGQQIGITRESDEALTASLTASLRHRFLPQFLRARAMLAPVLVTVLLCTPFTGGAPRAIAATLPFAGDDAFLAGAVAVADGTTTTVVIDRAYGELADEAGHLASSLPGATVSATADFDVAPTDGAMPGFDVTINGAAVSGPWGVVPGQVGVYRLTVPTADLRFPALGDETHALTPQANVVAFSGGAGDAASLAWLRLTVTGTPPVLLVAGADLACTPSGPLPVDETFGDWARWLTADGIPFVAPDRDGHGTVAEQLPFLDNGYAAIRRMYGPDRPGLSPRVTLLGYSMGGLVAREWAAEHPGVVARFITVSTPNGGTDAARSSLAALAARCASGAIHDLTPEFVASFNARYDLAHYWDPAPATEHVVSLAAAPVIGNLSDGLVTKDSALALTYAQKLVWTPATRVFSLHQAVMHAPQVYHDLRTWSQFDQPTRDTRTAAPPA